MGKLHLWMRFDEKSLEILSYRQGCQTGVDGQAWKSLGRSGGYYLQREDLTVAGDNFPNPVTGSMSCPPGFKVSQLPTVFQIVHLRGGSENPHYYLTLCL